MEGKNQSIDVRKRVIISDNVRRRKNQQKVLVLEVTDIETDPEVMVVVAGEIVLIVREGAHWIEMTIFWTCLFVIVAIWATSAKFCVFVD
jgi:hypothetical protein